MADQKKLPYVAHITYADRTVETIPYTRSVIEEGAVLLFEGGEGSDPVSIVSLFNARHIRFRNAD